MKSCYLLFVIFSAASLARATSSFPRATIDRYCLGCHTDKVRSGGVSLTAASARAPEANPEVWEKVIRKVSQRQMPPPGLPRPDEPTYDALVTALTATIDEAASANANAGRTGTFRRLNRAEYRNAVRDLLSVDVDVSSLLPADEASHGFDNVTVGNLSPLLMEKYLAAAQKISRLALGSPLKSPGGDTIFIPPDLTQEEQLSGLPFGTRGGAIVPYNFPVNGQYEIQLRLARDRNERVEGLDDTHQMELMVDGRRAALFTLKPTPRTQDHSKYDQDLNARLLVSAGPHTIGVAFVRKTSALIETERQPYLAHFNMDRHPRIQPALYSVAVVGPYEQNGAADSPSRRALLACNPLQAPEEDACAERTFYTLLRRAYRRPTTQADLRTPMKLYREAKAAGGFNSGIEMGLRAILANPQFLFRIEKDPPGIQPGTSYRINDIDLASRLSFFLWSSIPDEELLDLAAKNKLHDGVLLEGQVRRMLADRRSETLTANFASQWLYLRNLASVVPDPRSFPDFDDNLRQSFRRETELFFDSIVREDRNALDLLRADYTFLNERLAKHYSIPNVYGSRFRRVQLAPSAMRGGLLGQGSILTVTSYATRTSPVIRGKWVLTNILGSPPAPPPPDIPPLKESVANGKALTMRERVAQHRANPVCAGCHNAMDPVGFALENFDAVGRWRSKDSGVAVDASGSLPDGTTFSGPIELQRAVLRRPELFVSTLTEKLLTFALGRGIEYYDAPAIRQVVRESKGSNYRFSSLILGIVRSTPFQMRSSL